MSQGRVLVLVERTQFGKYTIVAKIGQGAMGDVYKAHDAILDRHVALKTITSSLEASPDARLRFHREAQSIARLNHPNIVTVHDFGEEGGEVYMAMEFLEGADLRRLISEKRLTTLDEKLALIEQVCEGVGYAHSKSVIHRDLKPANIHVLNDGRVKVMDFGLARIGAASGMTQTGTVLGTPHYMSPEQVKGQKADPRSDVFALGAILYELLTGHQPFEAESMHAVLFKILESEPEPVRRWCPDAPTPIVALAAKTLSKDPEQRFANGSRMAAVVGAVRAELSGEGSRPPGSLITLLAAEESDITHAIPSGLEATHGNLALEALVASDAQAQAPEPVETRQGTPTLSGKAPTRPGPTPGRRPDAAAEAPGGSGKGRVMLGVAAAVVVVAGGLIAWGTLRSPGGSTATSAPAADTGTSDLQRQLLAAERKLAQESLQDREYREAIDHAERALGVQPDDGEALRVREAAQQALDSADAAATTSRAALEQGDTTTASRRLEELLEIQPGHPAVAELTAEMNAIFRPQAEQARKAMRQAEAQARQRGASGDAMARGDAMSREGAGAFAQDEYATATERFLAARDAFSRAGRVAAARQAEAPAPTRATAAPPAATAAPAQREPPRQTSPRPAPPPEPRPAPPARASTTPPDSSPPSPARPSVDSPVTTSAAPPPVAVVPPPAAPSAPAPEPARGPSDEAQIRDLVGDYGRAIVTKDLALFRRVKPNLSGDEEQRLRQAFEVGEQDVDIKITAVEVSGDTAHVRLVRTDTIGGKAFKPREQVLSLRRGPQGWTVESIGR